MPSSCKGDPLPSRGCRMVHARQGFIGARGANVATPCPRVNPLEEETMTEDSEAKKPLIEENKIEATKGELHVNYIGAENK